MLTRSGDVDPAVPHRRAAGELQLRQLIGPQIAQVGTPIQDRRQRTGPGVQHHADAAAAKVRQLSRCAAASIVMDAPR